MIQFANHTLANQPPIVSLSSTLGSRHVISKSRLLDRFLRYVRIASAADPSSSDYPSSPGQRELGRILFDELVAMGADDVQHDDNGLVWATIPSTAGAGLPAVALIAHVDTSPEAPDKNVLPQVVESYDGGVVPLPSGLELNSTNSPTLSTCVGKTIVTTDGNTLLGGDDKAGVAIIMEVAHHLIERPHIAHGPLKVLFTCDEEIGRGTDKIDLQKLGATVAYTIDGGGAGMIDVETFSADAMRVTFIGHNIHPAIAKGQMVNSLRGAAAFVDSLPKSDRTPETTEGRDGFIHVHDIHGGVGRCAVDLILRSFVADQLDDFAAQVVRAAEAAIAQTPGMTIEVERRRQYRNLAEGLKKLPESVELARQAFKNLGLPYQTAIVRGGTDGSQLTEKGLPTPNLSSGQHNIHSVLEFACLDQMADAAAHAIELLKLWGEKRS
jgi:tripeptide aminopeptidase